MAQTVAVTMAVCPNLFAGPGWAHTRQSVTEVLVDHQTLKSISLAGCQTQQS
jgi:hypothetical protein